jgi:hypothetical protein
MNSQPAHVFLQGRPFFEMVTSFLAATIGMGPVFDPKNPLNLSPETIAWYGGIVRPHLAIDMAQIHYQCTSGALSADTAVKSLCCMLINATYEAAKSHNDYSPEFEFFRHLRNAASHRNTFNFSAKEPQRPASWGGLTIDHTCKGTTNPRYGTECVGTAVSAGDVIALLHDIEARLP